MSRVVARIAALAAGHFLVAIAVALTAFGSDMDRLRSRSALSRAAGVLNDLLMLPHDRFMRAIPNHWIVDYPWLIPAALAANSLVWGVALYLGWRGVERGRTKGDRAMERGQGGWAR